MSVQFSPQRNPRVIIIQKLYSKLFNNEENITFPKHRFKKFIKENLKKLSSFSVMAVIGPTCLIVSTFIVRDYIFDEFGSDYAGSWEAMWRISAIYLLFLITTFKFYLIPTFSKLNDNELKFEVFKIWKVVIPIIIIITFGVYLTKDLIINI